MAGRFHFQIDLILTPVEIWSFDNQLMFMDLQYFYVGVYEDRARLRWLPYRLHASLQPQTPSIARHWTLQTKLEIPGKEVLDPTKKRIDGDYTLGFNSKTTWLARVIKDKGRDFTLATSVRKDGRINLSGAMFV